MSAETLLRRLLTELKQDNTNDGGYDCLWCGRSANMNYDALVGFTWHADDCDYLAAHLYVAAAERQAELKNGFAHIADLVSKDGDA